MNIDGFDLNLLRVFDAVMAERNVSLAGMRLGLSQSAISNALARMRRQCDDALFVRTSHGMQPTPFAAEMAQPVRTALATLTAALEQNVHFDPRSSRRQFKVALSDVGAAVFLPTLLRHFASDAPGLRLTVVQFPYEQIGAALENGLAELAIGGQSRPGQSFYQQKLYTDSWVCVMRRGHPLAAQRLTAKAYSSAGHAMGISPAYWRSVTNLTALRHRPDGSVRLEVPHILALPPILAASDLVATLTLTTVRHMFPEPHFITKPLPFRSASMDVMQFWHSRYHRDAGAKWLRQQIARHFGGHMPEPGLPAA